MTYSILLVEDNPGDAELVRIALSETPSLGAFDIHHVDRMERAIPEVASKRYDAILLDLNLPDSSGLQTLAMLSAYTNGDPIVVLTGSDDELLGLKALRNGAHDYLVKGQVFGTMMARAVLYAIQRHRTDAALRTTEAQHRMLFETMAQGAVYYDGAGRVIDANPAALQFFGRSLEELRSHAIAAGEWKMVQEDGTPFQPDEHPTAIALRTGHEKNSTVIGVFNAVENEQRWMMVHAKPHFHPGESSAYQVITTFTDITALQRAEEALRSKEERFRTLIEHASDLTVVISSDGRVTYCSPSISRIVGYEAEAVMGMHFLQLCVEQDRARVQESMSRVMTEPNASASEVWVARHADGSTRRLEVFSRNLLHHPAIGGIVANVKDTTASYEAEQDLRAANERLAAVVDTSPLAILVVDELHNVQIWNRAAERIFGWAAEDVVGRPYPIVAPADAVPVQSVFNAAFEGKVVQGLELQRVTKAGEVVNIKLWNEQLRDATGRVSGLVGIIADMSEQKELEDALRHAQKMEAVGRLAGGIAHDFNNILTALSGHSGLLLEAMPDGDALREDVLEIEKGVNRAAMLTRQLLTFSRKQVVQPRVVDLNTLTSDMTKMLTRILGEDIGLEVNTAAAPVCVIADPGQLEQVIVNLAVNARDAMPFGGLLSVKISEASAAQAERPRSLPRVRDDYALLEVVDNGCGITTEEKAKIFDPFFTTKPQGKGTGLGLSTVYGIVEKAGGVIHVDSSPGAGATFRIFLPQVQEEPTRDLAVTRTQVQGSGVILLVEDEASVRQLTERILVRQGYTVLSAPGGSEAVSMMEGRDRIDLLITDVVMPHMSGREVAELVRAKWSSTEVLYMSGYTEETITHHGVLEPGIHFLEKPFTPDQIISKVSALILRAPPV